MITKDNLKDLLNILDFKEKNNIYEKKYNNFSVKVDFDKKKIFYPENTNDKDNPNGIIVNDQTTCNFSKNENFVVLECVIRLLDKGYKHSDIELEPKWKIGGTEKGGKADILVKQEGNPLFIVECKTYGAEYKKELENMEKDGGQLFSYWQQVTNTKWLVLYASDIIENEIKYICESINCNDDANILDIAKNDNTILTYANSHTNKELFNTWVETYKKKLCGDVIFTQETQAYNIGEKPLLKKDLIDFGEESKNIVNGFLEILRHNNVSDRENAFNRLTALFICKLVDEIKKRDEDEVEFQYKNGKDTYESLQDRLQRLHKEGMDKFMKEEIFYLPEDYAENMVKQFTGRKRENMIEDLKENLRKLKFYSNNDFAFKDVHNRELFLQNGKILVEVVQLFEKYKIINSNDIQKLGDMFEQLLDKGFKQNEGQFFTPMPITEFIWRSLPIERFKELPKVIDYACGAGHFLTVGAENIERVLKPTNNAWERDSIFGIEKDYRLARVSKISLYMHGAGDGNIIFGDGLENYEDKGIKNNSFEILVANPPYSVKDFKKHLNLKNNSFDTLQYVKNGGEIETLFVERISQLLKSKGIACVILPVSILTTTSESYISAREFILKNFYIRALILMGTKTFGATGTNTVIMFLEKFQEPPKQFNINKDFSEGIINNKIIEEENKILEDYLNKINVSKDFYLGFIEEKIHFKEYKSNEYFNIYYKAFIKQKENLKFNSKLSTKNNVKNITKKFLEYVKNIEKEKITYFALCNNNKTLIVNSPSDNNQQEKFLGYTWSNRKGQEGIQIRNLGGLLYNPNDIEDKEKVSYLVKEMFYNKVNKINEELDAYYLNTADMLDFGKTDFDKNISTNNIIILNKKYKNEKLINLVKFNTKNINQKEIKNIEYHYVDISSLENDKINYSNLINGNELPSRAKRLAKNNDILISTVRPYQKKFAIIKDIPENTIFSTGYCILEIIDNNIITNEYLLTVFKNDIILMKQIFSKMERGAYPSINQNDIENFYIPIPNITEQNQIVEEFDKIDKEIAKQENIIDKTKFNIKEEFNKKFTNEKTKKLGELAEIIRGVTYDKENESYNKTNNIVLTADNITLDGDFILKKEIYVSNNITFEENKKLKENDIFICMSSGSKEHVGKNTLIKKDTNYYIGGFMGIIRLKTNVNHNINSIYLNMCLNSENAKIYYKNNSNGSNIQNLNNLENLDIPYPTDDHKLKEFDSFVNNQNAIIEKAKTKKEELLLEKEKLVDEYFK